MKKIIMIPYLLVDNNKDYKPFILATYIYLYVRGGLDGMTYASLNDILIYGYGYKNVNVTIQKDSIAATKKVIGMLQRRRFILTISDPNTGEIIDINNATLKQQLCFDMSPMREQFNEKFVMLELENYNLIKSLEPSARWRTLILYLYFVYRIGYNPFKETSFREYWRSPYEDIANYLGDGFTKASMGKIFATLRELGLIAYKSVYIDENCNIGNVVILQHGEPPNQIEERLKSASYRAKAEYKEFCVNKSLENAALAYAEKGA